MNLTELTDPFDREHLWHPYGDLLNPLPALEVVKTQGCTITLKDGTDLVDGTSSWWCAVHGYNHPYLLQAVQEQLHKFPHVMFAGLTHDRAIELGKHLCKILPPGLDKIFYADSGSVAVEAAMKMALQYQLSLGRTQKNNFVTIYNGYHGDTFYAMSVCDPVNGMHSLFGPALPKRYFLPAPRITPEDNFDPNHEDVVAMCAFIEEHHENIAGFILEPVMQAAGGMLFYHPRYLDEIRAVCDKYDIVLIFDEIASAFYRLKKDLACRLSSSFPDIICLGKALTGGVMTLSAIGTGDKIAGTISANRPHAFMHGPTFMANPLACAAACASLELMERDDYGAKAQNIETILRRELQPLQDCSAVKAVRVFGAVGAVELKERADVRYWQQELVKRGVWLRPFSNVVYILPPLVITDEELLKLTAALKDIVIKLK